MMIEIDGSYLEGGGQILRTAASLSCVTKKPCHVFNIRKNRPKPGLQTQHLLGLQALSQICNGRLEGDFLNSEDIKFWPGETYQERISINIETAASITLILQALIPPALSALNPVTVSFSGGATDTFFSPTIDYFRSVFLKTLEKMGAKIDVEILKRGYYPEGGAEIKVKIFPSELKSLRLADRGNLKKITIISGASESLKDKKTSERQLAGTREIMARLKLPLEEKAEYYPTRCPGSQVCLIAEFENTVIGEDILGKMGKNPEDIGKETALELLKEERTGSCLDKYLADQVLPYLALAKGPSDITVSEITNHCKTNMWVIEKFLEGHFKVQGNSIIWPS